jgi:hypothetical protein
MDFLDWENVKHAHLVGNKTGHNPVLLIITVSLLIDTEAITPDIRSLSIMVGR